MRAVILSEEFETVKICYAADMAADDQIKDCCRACVLGGGQAGEDVPDIKLCLWAHVSRLDLLVREGVSHPRFLSLRWIIPPLSYFIFRVNLR